MAQFLLALSYSFISYILAPYETLIKVRIYSHLFLFLVIIFIPSNTISMTNIILNENQFNKLFYIDESVTYTPVGSANQPVVDMTINHDLDDGNNLAVNNIDTRVFGRKFNLSNTLNKKSLTIREKYIGLTVIQQMYNDTITYAKYKGCRKLNLPTDNDLNALEVSPRQISIIKRTRDSIMDIVSKNLEIRNFEAIIQYCERKLNERQLRDEVNTNYYNRFNEFQRKPWQRFGQLIPRYKIGTVPQTNVKFIALFSMADFNFSDAIKHGKLRPVTGVKSLFNTEINNTIPVTYDGGIPANLENNFSLPETPDSEHQKRQYGYEDRNYTSVTKFLDKSIMAASFALNKEGYKPQYIIAAPSSSKFNHYYCQNLSQKIGTAEYIPDFFQRNLINFKDEEGQVIADKMRKEGVPDNLIHEFQRTLEGVALREISMEIAKPIRKLIADNYNIIASINTGSYSREKVNIDKLTRAVLSYSYKVLVKTLQNSNDLQISNMARYLTGVFLNNETKTTTLNPELVNAFLSRVSKYKTPNRQISKRTISNDSFESAIGEMYNLIVKYSSQLENEGYKLTFNKPFKITMLSRAVRPYLTTMYVVADKNFNKNHELLSKFKNAKFLIVDEDLNSGATLANVIYALQNALPEQDQSNIMCLVNGYSSGGR